MLFIKNKFYLIFAISIIIMLIRDIQNMDLDISVISIHCINYCIACVYSFKTYNLLYEKVIMVNIIAFYCSFLFNLNLVWTLLFDSPVIINKLHFDLFLLKLSNLSHVREKLYLTFQKINSCNQKAFISIP